MTKTELLKAIEATHARSAWEKAVNLYAYELVEDYEGDDITLDSEQALLNGADSWLQYSYGGCSLIYDTDIAERTCSPSGLKKVKGGELNPNSRETWLDVQARALFQAWLLIERLIRKHDRKPIRAVSTLTA